MANISVDWEVEGIITPEESVTKMLKVFATKSRDDSGTFWCWDGRVGKKFCADAGGLLIVFVRNILGRYYQRSSTQSCCRKSLEMCEKDGHLD